MVNDVTTDFKAYHFSIVDQITDEEDARAEQEILTEYELKVMNLIDRICKLIEVQGSVGKKEDREKIVLRKRMNWVEKFYSTIKTEVDEDGPGVDVYTIQSYDERVKSNQAELQGINGDLLSIDDSDERGTTLSPINVSQEAKGRNLFHRRQAERWVCQVSNYLESRYQRSMATYLAGGSFGNSLAVLSEVRPT